MPSKKAQLKIVSRNGQPAPPRSAPPTVSGRWLLGALGAVVAAALVCVWGSLCLLFWQGAWQLLYRPASVIARTPAAVGLKFDPVGFAATETGAPRLRGWWIPAGEGVSGIAASSQYTVLYLHDRTGNLGTCVDELAAIHAAGANILAFDYRGYGQSQFVHPSEARWRQDSDWALYYLTATRQAPVSSIVVAGSGLGANLALEVAAAHPELAGVVLDSPLASPLEPVLSDARARLVPVRLLFHDRYSMLRPAAALRIPSLWLLGTDSSKSAAPEKRLIAAYGAVAAPKTLVRVADKYEVPALKRWLAGLHANHS